MAYWITDSPDLFKNAESFRYEIWYGVDQRCYVGKMEQNSHIENIAYKVYVA